MTEELLGEVGEGWGVLQPPNEVKRRSADMSKKAWRLDTKGKFAGTKSCTKYVAIWEVPANQTFVPASNTVCRLKYQSTFPTRSLSAFRTLVRDTVFFSTLLLHSIHPIKS